MYNAFESLQAFELGTGQRKERERETAMKNIGNAFASGDLDTAARMAFQYDPAYGMQVKKYADDQGALSTRKEIGGMFAAGDRTGALNRAMADGSFDLGASLYNMDRTMKAGGQEDYMGGIKDFVDRSGEIMALEEGDPRRAEMAMQIVSTSMFKDNPQFIAAVQQAAADGRITNTEIQSFQQKLMTVGEQIQQGQWQASFDREGQYREEDVDWRTSQAAEEARRFGLNHGLAERGVEAAEAKAGKPLTRYLSPEELKAAGYPEGAVVQVDAGGDDQVRFKPESEYTSGQKNKYINDAAQLEAYDATLQEYLNLVDTVGLKKFYKPDDPDVAKLEAMQQSLSFGAKDLFQLGVLSKDDYEAINRIIPDATGIEAMLKNKESFMASAQPLEDYIARAYNAIPQQFRGRGEQPVDVDQTQTVPGDGGANLPTVNNITSYAAIPPGGYYLSPDGNTRQKPHEIGSITNPNQFYPDRGN